jgi:hypothetical protein
MYCSGMVCEDFDTKHQKERKKNMDSIGIEIPKTFV